MTTPDAVPAAVPGAVPGVGVECGRVCTVAACGRPHLARGYCRTHYERWRRRGDPAAAVPIAARAVAGRTAEEAGVGYKAAHRRVGRVRGPAVVGRCASCGGPGAVWSYDGTDPDERTDPRRGCRYSVDPARYVRRCRFCHRRAVVARHTLPNTTGRRRPALDVPRAAVLYRAGATAGGIAASMGVSRPVVLRALRAAGVAIRPTGRRPLHPRPDSTTP